MATLPTGGFTQSRIQLQPGLVDPRILALDLSAIGRGANQGLQLADNFSQMRDRAIARQQEAEFRPLVNLNRRLQLEAGPQLLRSQIELNRINTIKAQNTPVVLDESQSIEEVYRDAPDGGTYATPDVMSVTSRRVLNPVTGKIETIKSYGKPVATIEQQGLAEDLANQRAENLRLSQERIDASNANAEAIDARARDAAADRDARARERIEIDRQLADLRGKVEDRQARQGAARLSDADRAQALRELNALTNNKALNTYYDDTRDTSGVIRQEDVPGMLNFGTQPVTLTPEMENLITRRNQLRSMLYDSTADLITPPAPVVNAPMVTFPPVAGSPLRRSPAPSDMDTPAVDYAPIGASTTAATGPAITAPAPIPAPVPATPTAPNAPASRAQIPTLSPQQARSLPPNSPFYGTDGILYRTPPAPRKP